MPERRRAPTLVERLTPCVGCGLPLTHRHHPLDFALYGESVNTWQLCANCHDVFHICWKAYHEPTQRIHDLWMTWVNYVGHNSPKIAFMYDKVRETRELKTEYGLATLNADCSDWKEEE